MIRPILTAQDARLRKKSKPVAKIDKKVLSLIKDLKDTLKAQKDPEGVGLAAPQIGKNFNVFVFTTPKGLKTIINPKVISVIKDKTKRSKEKILEGCLSLINFYGPLTRPEKIRLKYMTESGKEIIETFLGFDAQIIQHEIDHLNGVLFIDRLIEQKKPLYEHVDDEWEEVEI